MTRAAVNRDWRDAISCEIPLTKGYVTLVDEGDYTWLSQWKWCAEVKDDDVYAFRSTTLPALEPGRQRRGRLYMHREILGISDLGRAVIGDHIDGCTLDNRRFNLRAVTPSQSQMNRGPHSNNTSGVKGVSFKAGKWAAQITIENELIYLGWTDTLEAAVHLREEAENKYFGCYARK